MLFEWDEAKRQGNLAKHGVDLLDAALIFERMTMTARDNRRDYGEPRYKAVGIADGVCYVVVYTLRGDAVRLIAAWKGGRNVRRDYEARVARGYPGDEDAG